MKKMVQDHGLGFPINSATYRVDKSPHMAGSSSASLCRLPTASSYRPSQTKKNKILSIIGWMNKLTKKSDSIVNGVREHVKMGPKISETVMAKLSLGAKILQGGGVEKLFKKTFCVGAKEKLFQACQCYLSTTAGPIAGLLFISSEKIAFCSDRPLTFTSPKGALIRTPYKVMIPLKKIHSANPGENVNKPTEKYIQIVTVDRFEFWFMAFVNYKTAFKCLQQAVTLTSEAFPQ